MSADYRAGWITNDDGALVPRRTAGSVAAGFSDRDFALVCKLCGDDYSGEPNLPVGVVQAHFNRHHPGEPVALDLLWLGQGPAPHGGAAAGAMPRLPGGPVFADLADMPEDERIRAIADQVTAGARVAFIVEDAAKAERYLEKLRALMAVKVIERRPGPVEGTVLVKVVGA